MFLFVAALLMTSELGAQAQESGAEPSFEERFVEFHNGDVALAGSLLLPTSDAPHPAVVFVHGAGRHTRKAHREVSAHFASQGFAALIYDKRGTGKSSGVYESSRPYTNLVKDALAAVAFLKRHPEIEHSQIGIWGLSQGAYISAAAASRTSDIQFIIAAGASAADGSFFYYCDNLFRKYELVGGPRDIAAKGHLARRDLGDTLRHGLGVSSFVPRRYPPPVQFVHPAWSGVTQPVLAMWGDLDQNVPVGESVAGLKNSLAQANNSDWTMIILPQANHDLGVSDTGELQSKWRGYSPGALDTMTDWAQTVLTEPTQIASAKQIGVAREAGIRSRILSYERLRWYGNSTVQIALWILFFSVFLGNTITGTWRCVRSGSPTATAKPGWVQRLRYPLSVLNLLIMVALSITILLLIDQLRPSCPLLLRYVPLLGTASTAATLAFLVVLVRTWRDKRWTSTGRLKNILDAGVLALFVPYLAYWNMIGVRL